MNRDMGMFLGNMIGCVEDIDVGPSGKCLGKFIWIKLKLTSVNHYLRV